MLVSHDTEKLEEIAEKIKQPNSNAIQNCELVEVINPDREKEKAEIYRFNQDTQLKKQLANFVIWFTVTWSFAILVLLYFNAFSITHLSDKEIIALLTETLATVIGLPIIAAKHFFPTDK